MNGKWQPGHRHDPDGHPDVDKGVHHYEGGDTDGDQSAEGVARPGGDHQQPPDDHQEEAKHQPSPDEPELLPTAVKMKSVGWEGT